MTNGGRLQTLCNIRVGPGDAVISITLRENHSDQVDQEKKKISCRQFESLQLLIPHLPKVVPIMKFPDRTRDIG